MSNGFKTGFLLFVVLVGIIAQAEIKETNATDVYLIGNETHRKIPQVQLTNGAYIEDMSKREETSNLFREHPFSPKNFGMQTPVKKLNTVIFDRTVVFGKGLQNMEHGKTVVPAGSIGDLRILEKTESDMSFGGFWHQPDSSVKNVDVDLIIKTKVNLLSSTTEVIAHCTGYREIVNNEGGSSESHQLFVYCGWDDFEDKLQAFDANTVTIVR
jgi:hypothetical protein